MKMSNELVRKLHCLIEVRANIDTKHMEAGDIMLLLI